MTTMPHTAEFDVQTNWLDANGHMNAKPYFLVLADALDIACDALGFGAPHRAAGFGLFLGDVHITYVREVGDGDRLRVISCLAEFDSRRFIIHQQMLTLRQEALAATAEHVQLNVDLATRRVAPFAGRALQRLEAARVASGASQLPNRGRSVSLRAGSPQRNVARVP